MSHEATKKILTQMHKAWCEVTVLEDKSYDNFHRIVMLCCDTIKEKFQEGKTESYCSTGSVFVRGMIAGYDKENPYRYEVMVTPCFSIEGC